MFEQDLNEENTASWNHVLTNENGFIYTAHSFTSSLSSSWKIVSIQNSPNLLFSWNKKLGFNQIYMPFFCRELHFSGTIQEGEQVIQHLKKKYTRGLIQLRIEIPTEKPSHKTYQIIDKELKLNTLAKRKIKKASQNEVEIRKIDHWKDILLIIETELGKKVPEINSESMKRMDHLCRELANKKQLICFGIYHRNQLHGGLLLAEDSQRIYYIKGACQEKTRDFGGMFLGMKTAIEHTLTKEKTFDFGGSSVPSVRQFNQHFGGKDQVYYCYSWDYTPYWFQILIKFKNQLTKIGSKRNK